ncbi:hypothetical protein ACSBR1_018314 [Camellia fascicularis]
MASDQDHTTVYGGEDLDEDDDEDTEEDDLALIPSQHHLLRDDVEEDDLDDDDDDDTSSSAALVTVALPSTPLPLTVVADPNRLPIKHVTIAAVADEKKPLPALDESRRLFQRLWTDEDEIELLQGFLNYTAQRGGNTSSHHHDTTAFYDQIKSKLQLDFNKNQLVEKLRRLKKKYRNVLNKIGSGKEYLFKTPHDQATFEISRKIWSSIEEAGLEEDIANLNPNPNPNSIDHNSNGVDVNCSEKKGSRPPRKRSRVKIDEKQQFDQQPHQIATPVAASIPNSIEETVRSCLSPLFKELLHNAMNGLCGSRGFGGVAAALNPMPLSFGGGDMMDEKWRKQQILELEVYSKRLELVQDQIKSALEELRSI